MDKKAENVIQNVGAIAETTSIFYNTLSRQVPKDVALVLSQHFMDLLINQRAVAVTPEQLVQAVLTETRRRQSEQQKPKDDAQDKHGSKNNEPPEEEQRPDV